MYDTIINPETGLVIQTKSYLGRSIINKYIKNLIGYQIESTHSGGSSGTPLIPNTQGHVLPINIRIVSVKRSGTGLVAKDLIWQFTRTATLDDLTDRIQLTYPSFPKALLSGVQLFKGPPPNRGSLTYVYPMPSSPSIPPQMPIQVTSQASVSLPLVNFQHFQQNTPLPVVPTHQPPGFYLVLPDLNRPIV
tara:strand:+ start:269 stop:841 length:573 start_codon:yes stop_codon:yes gene_type:complete